MGFGDFIKSAAGGDIIGSAIGAVGSLIGGGMSSNAAAAQAALQYQHQKEFAQNGVRWKVEDAKRAGIHPLAALGAQTFSYSPVGIQASDGGVSEALGRMGQGISRAYESKQLEEKRQLDKALVQANIDKTKAETNYVNQQAAASQAAITKTALPPPMPKVNDVPYSLDAPYGKDFYTLLTLARHGDTLYELPHPDIADSITETEWKNILSMIDAEAQAQSGIIKAPVYKLTPSERKAVSEHRYQLVRVPGVGWKLDRNPSRPHPYDKLSKYEKFIRKNSQKWSNGRKEVTGKIF